MSKADRTRQRYAKSFKDQTRLDAFFHPRGGSTIPQARCVSDRSISSNDTQETVDLDDSGLANGWGSDKSVEIIDTPADNLPSSSHRDISVAPSVPESELTERMPDNNLDEEHSDDEDSELPQSPEEMETWEEELEEDISSNPTEIKDWTTLRAQIKADLKKNEKKTGTVRNQ